MQASESIAFIWFPIPDGVVGPIILLAAIIFIAVLWYVRERRNDTLENLVMQTEFGPPESFRGTLAVEEYQSGRFLRLSASTASSRRLQFWYRWVVGMGRQPVFDEVIIDGPRGSVDLRRKNEHKTASFSEFSAIQMREVARGRDGGTLWHIELVPSNGRPLPFVTSERGDRKAMFDQTASLAKAFSGIMTVPVHVVVAGNIWTPGWPPKNSTVTP